MINISKSDNNLLFQKRKGTFIVSFSHGTWDKVYLDKNRHSYCTTSSTFKSTENNIHIPQGRGFRKRPKKLC